MGAPLLPAYGAPLNATEPDALCIDRADLMRRPWGAQLVAVHEAAMEAFRRAALAEQTFAGREMGLKYGAKLTRTYAALLETLDRHRGKGQPQVVRVKRVTVEAGGQAIVGGAQGGGAQDKSE